MESLDCFLLVLRCCPMIDAMVIWQHIQYDPHTSQCLHVDIGDGEAAETKAKEGLAFTAVRLSWGWKFPVVHLNKVLADI